ncbi:MAG: helix-turn-helix domain-containing protein [Thiohalomonadaceae bacterium]
MLHYTTCGLGNVYLRNGYAERQTPYGRAVSIHDLDGLHRTIGMNLIQNSPDLSGEEVRFLRKEMDLSQQHLARMLGVGESSVRGWEAGRTPITKPAERMLRVLYHEYVQGCTMVAELIERISHINRDIHFLKLELEDTGHGWRLADAA